MLRLIRRIIRTVIINIIIIIVSMIFYIATPDRLSIIKRLRIFHTNIAGTKIVI